MPKADTGWLKRILQLQPSIVRSFIVAVTGILAQVIGHTVVDADLIDGILNAYTSISALVAGLWIYPAVTPFAKVVAYKPDPTTSDVVATGPAAPTAGSTDADINFPDPVSDEDKELRDSADSQPLFGGEASSDDLPEPPEVEVPTAPEDGK